MARQAEHGRPSSAFCRDWKTLVEFKLPQKFGQLDCAETWHVAATDDGVVVVFLRAFQRLDKCRRDFQAAEKDMKTMRTYHGAIADAGDQILRLERCDDGIDHVLVRVDD
ncbi:unnamed protein product [Aphanomyces euteiches]